jgi:hypothetical protein
MGTKPEHRPILERLLKKYRIIFFEEVAQHDWPPNHTDVFKAAKKLAEIKYDDYTAKGDALGESVAATEEPWKSGEAPGENSDRKGKKLCVRRNEATWRLACEPMVLCSTQC